MVNSRAAGWAFALLAALLMWPTAWAAPPAPPADEDEEEESAAVATAPVAAPAADPAAPPPPPPRFAKVGDKEINGMDFLTYLEKEVRRKFYHGKVPEAEMAAFQREVGKRLVERLLLLDEAKRRDIQVDEKSVEEKIAQYDQRYAESPMWKQNREAMLPSLREELNSRHLLSQLEAQVKNVGEPTEEQVKAYYDANPGKFTEPEDQKVSLILLKVDPGAGGAAWQTAQQQAQDLVKRLRTGKADFAELAQMHSGDATAEKGGKMGFMHKGTLAEPAELALAKIKPGEITDPVVVLEGVAIFKLDDRIAPERVPFAKAQPRAKELLKRELSEKAWKDLLTRLTTGVTIEINEKDYYLPLTEAKPVKRGHAPMGTKAP